jgi:hypothetical protein
MDCGLGISHITKGSPVASGFMSSDMLKGQ